MFKDLVDDLDGYSPDEKEFLDVPFVPTDDAVIEAMLNLADVGPDDVLYDLGSGDGRILITAARYRNTRGIGIEIDPWRIADAMEDAADSRVEFLVDFVEDDIFTADFSAATVVTLYLLDSVNVQLRPRLLNELRPGTRIISHAFSMADWQADERLDLGGVSIYKWVVPAQIAGAWEWVGLDGELYYAELEQKYQEISGNVWLDDELVELKSAKLSGNSLELEIQNSHTATPNRFTFIFENNELESAVQHL